MYYFRKSVAFLHYYRVRLARHTHFVYEIWERGIFVGNNSTSW